MLSAVQVYNNPQITFKSETFITLAVRELPVESSTKQNLG